MPKALWKIINYNYHNHHNIDVPIRRTKIFYAEELSPPSIKLINNSKNSSSHSASLPNNSTNSNHPSIYQNNQVSKNKENNKAPSPWEQLPIEILVFIFSHLSIKEIRQLTLICKKWQLVASSEHFWRTLHQIHFGGAKFDGRSWRFHCLFAYKEFKTIKKTGFFPGEENSANFMIDTIEHGANSLFRVINSENQIIHLPRWIYSSWMWAAERGHYQVLNSLYTDHSLVPSLEIRDLATRRTALYRAVQSSNTETIKWLLSVGAEVDARRDDEATPLFYAAGKGNLEIVKILVQNGADLNSTDRAGGSPLIMACQNRLLDVVHYLLPRCDVNQPLRDGETPLYVASMLGYCDVIDILLSYNADVNKARYNGATPFWIASKQGHLEALKRLAAVPGINTDIYVQGISCLEIALRKSHLHVAKFLIQLRQHDNHPQDYNNPRNLIETRPTLHVARSVSVM